MVCMKQFTYDMCIVMDIYLCVYVWGMAYLYVLFICYVRNPAHAWMLEDAVKGGFLVIICRGCIVCSCKID